MTLDALTNCPSWQWPRDAAETLLAVLEDRGAEAADRLMAVELAGDCVVMNDELAAALLSILRSDSETEELRCWATVALGPALEETDTMGFDDPEGELVTEATFHEIQRSLRELHRSAEVPLDVRRMTLEAAVRAPEDWQVGAIGAAYASENEAWRLTAVFCMRFIGGFDEQILEALAGGDPAVVSEAVHAADRWSLDAAWPTVAAIVQDPDAERHLLAAAIDAAASIRPLEARDILAPLMSSKDEEIAEVASQAMSMAQLATAVGEPGDADEFDAGTAPVLQGLPDRRSMESVLSGLTGRNPSAVSSAQDLMYEAFEEPDPERRLDLARRALDVSSDCADAWVLIAEEGSRTRRETLDAYAHGVAAGERALGPAAFEEDVGHFWGLLETRPYMRARQGLARCLQEAGRVGEALNHYRDMIRLNPNDNQGVRWMLLDLLLEEGLDDEARELLGQYEDDAYAGWSYGAALLAFRKEGDGETGRALLARAVEVNPHVPAYLTGSRRMPKTAPELMSYGRESEAVVCVTSQKAAWRNAAGALPWLKERTGKKTRRRR